MTDPVDVKVVSKRAYKLTQIKEKCESDLLAGEIEKLISTRIIALMDEELLKENGNV